MKNMFKLAAVAVSMALAASLVACSSGDDVVDASTPKYLLAERIDKYVASIKYDQNVSDKEIESLGKAHDAEMEFFGGCEDCLGLYFKTLKKDLYIYVEGEQLLDSDGIKDVKDSLEADLRLKKSCYGKENVYHRMYVYRPAIDVAIGKVGADSKAREKVLDIGESDGNKILDSKLNGRQLDTMKAYTDAAAALKAALSDDDKKTCETIIKAADAVIGAFKNENVTKPEIVKVIAAVDAMSLEIKTKVSDAIFKKYNDIETEYRASLVK